MMISKTGRIYWIDRSMNIYKLKNSPDVDLRGVDMLLDGELIYNKITKKYAYFVFDALYYAGTNLGSKSFNERFYEYFLNKALPVIKNISLSDLDFVMKEYFPVDILQKQEYKSKGINAYTLLKLYMKRAMKVDVPSDGIIFHPVDTPYKNGTWSEPSGINVQYKWKPREHLTVDFRIVKSSGGYRLCVLGKSKDPSEANRVCPAGEITYTFRKGEDYIVSEYLLRGYSDKDIVEFGWDYEGRKWVPVRQRPDKNTPNAIFVVIETNKLIRDPVDIEDIEAVFANRDKYPEWVPEQSTIEKLQTKTKGQLLKCVMDSKSSRWIDTVSNFITENWVQSTILQKWDETENLEIEIRLGKITESGFDTDVGAEFMSKIKEKLDNYQENKEMGKLREYPKLYMKEEMSTIEYYPEGRLVIDSKDKSDRTFEKKVKMASTDISTGKMDIRVAVSKEIEKPIPEDLGAPSSVRQRQRIRYIAVPPKNLFNLLVPNDISYDIACDLTTVHEYKPVESGLKFVRTVYQIELESLDPDRNYEPDEIVKGFYMWLQFLLTPIQYFPPNINSPENTEESVYLNKIGYQDPGVLNIPAEYMSALNRAWSGETPKIEDFPPPPVDSVVLITGDLFRLRLAQVIEPGKKVSLVKIVPGEIHNTILSSELPDLDFADLERFKFIPNVAKLLARRNKQREPVDDGSMWVPKKWNYAFLVPIPNQWLWVINKIGERELVFSRNGVTAKYESTIYNDDLYRVYATHFMSRIEKDIFDVVHKMKNNEVISGINGDPNNEYWGKTMFLVHSYRDTVDLGFNLNSVETRIRDKFFIVKYDNKYRIGDIVFSRIPPHHFMIYGVNSVNLNYIGIPLSKYDKKTGSIIKTELHPDDILSMSEEKLAWDDVFGINIKLAEPGEYYKLRNGNIAKIKNIPEPPNILGNAETTVYDKTTDTVEHVIIPLVFFERKAEPMEIQSILTKKDVSEGEIVKVGAQFGMIKKLRGDQAEVLCVKCAGSKEKHTVVVPKSGLLPLGSSEMKIAARHFASEQIPTLAEITSKRTNKEIYTILRELARPYKVPISRRVNGKLVLRPVREIYSDIQEKRSG